MKNKGLWTLVGYLLFGLGLLAIVLSVVGVKLAFLTWIDAFGGLVGFLIKLLMLMTGLIIMFVARANWEDDSKEL